VSERIRICISGPYPKNAISAAINRPGGPAASGRVTSHKKSSPAGLPFLMC
jgi:hypothetical protein